MKKGKENKIEKNNVCTMKCCLIRKAVYLGET